MSALLVTVFVASLIGSLHCAGMCGGVVALCVGVDTGLVAARRRWHLHLAYNGGRLITYAALGAASGALGAAIDLSGSVLGLQRVAAMGAGALMIIMGLAVLLALNGVNLGCWKLPERLHRLFSSGLRAASGRPPLVRAGIIGLLTGFLPCGWLYAFVITAAGTGSAALGALTMAFFWAGTVPILVILGVGLQQIAGPLRRHVPAMTALALVVIGVVTVFGRLSVPAYADSLRAAAPSMDATRADRIDAVRALDHAAMPCCEKKGE